MIFWSHLSPKFHLISAALIPFLNVAASFLASVLNILRILTRPSIIIILFLFHNILYGLAIRSIKEAADIFPRPPLHLSWWTTRDNFSQSTFLRIVTIQLEKSKLYIKNDIICKQTFRTNQYNDEGKLLSGGKTSSAIISFIELREGEKGYKCDLTSESIKHCCEISIFWSFLKANRRSLKTVILPKNQTDTKEN